MKRSTKRSEKKGSEGTLDKLSREKKAKPPKMNEKEKKKKKEKREREGSEDMEERTRDRKIKKKHRIQVSGAEPNVAESKDLHEGYLGGNEGKGKKKKDADHFPPVQEEAVSKKAHFESKLPHQRQLSVYSEMKRSTMESAYSNKDIGDLEEEPLEYAGGVNTDMDKSEALASMLKRGSSVDVRKDTIDMKDGDRKRNKEKEKDKDKEKDGKKEREKKDEKEKDKEAEKDKAKEPEKDKEKEEKKKEKGEKDLKKKEDEKKKELERLGKKVLKQVGKETEKKGGSSAQTVPIQMQVKLTETTVTRTNSGSSTTNTVPKSPMHSKLMSTGPRKSSTASQGKAEKPEKADKVQS